MLYSLLVDFSPRVNTVNTLWLDVTLAFRNVVRQRRRSAVAIGSVAFGITALILASGFIEHIFWAFREGTIKSQLGHIQIVRPGYHDAGKADPYAFLLPDTIPELETEGQERHIKAVAPRLSFSGLASSGDATISFIGDGVSPKDEQAFGDDLHISAGENLSADAPLGIIMGEGLARNLDVAVGSKVVLLASTASGGTNAVETSVCGLFSTTTKAYDDAALRLPIVTARRLLRTGGAHAWVVLLDDTRNTKMMLDRLRDRLPHDRYEVVPWYALADFYNKTTELFGKQLEGIRLIIALIIMLGISTTMMMSVMERTGEIGTVLALGVKRSGVLRLFLAEGIVLGLLGGLLGLLVALAAAAAISAVGIPMPAPPGKAHGFIAGIIVTRRIALEALALAVGTTLAASIYPAWGASRQVIVDALRHNR